MAAPLVSRQMAEMANPPHLLRFSKQTNSLGYLFTGHRASELLTRPFSGATKSCDCLSGALSNYQYRDQGFKVEEGPDLGCPDKNALRDYDIIRSSAGQGHHNPPWKSPRSRCSFMYDDIVSSFFLSNYDEFKRGLYNLGIRSNPDLIIYPTGMIMHVDILAQQLANV